jgi:hypothetical protein
MLHLVGAFSGKHLGYIDKIEPAEGFEQHIATYLSLSNAYCVKLIRSEDEVQVVVSNSDDFTRALETVSRNGDELWETEFCDEKEVVMAAVQQNGLSLIYASARLREDKDMVLTAVRQNPESVRMALGDLKQNREVFLTAVSRWGGALQHAGPVLRSDRELVEVAIAQDGRSIEYAAPHLRADCDIIEQALRQNPQALKFVSPQRRRGRRH